MFWQGCTNAEQRRVGEANGRRGSRSPDQLETVAATATRCSTQVLAQPGIACCQLPHQRSLVIAWLPFSAFWRQFQLTSPNPSTSDKWKTGVAVQIKILLSSQLVWIKLVGYFMTILVNLWWKMRPYGGNFTNFLALMVNLLRNAVNLQI